MNIVLVRLAWTKIVCPLDKGFHLIMGIASIATGLYLKLPYDSRFCDCLEQPSQFYFKSVSHSLHLHELSGVPLLYVFSS